MKEIMKIFAEELEKVKSNESKIISAWNRVEERVPDDKKVMQCGYMYSVIMNTVYAINCAKNCGITELIAENKLDNSFVGNGKVMSKELCSLLDWGISEYELFLRYLTNELSRDYDMLFVIHTDTYDWFFSKEDSWYDMIEQLGEENPQIIKADNCKVFFIGCEQGIDEMIEWFHTKLMTE